MSEQDPNPSAEAPEAALPESPPEPALTALLRESFGDSVLDAHSQHGDETVTIRRKGMLEVFKFLRDDSRCQFEFMMDLSAVDYLALGRTPRFELVVHLKSLALHHRLRVKVPIEEGQEEVDSISSLWVAADWYERECYDMYGIGFAGHPDLRRLLMWDGFEGHPLRKDYGYHMQQPLVPLRPVTERHDYEMQIARPRKKPVTGTETETDA